MDFAYEADRVYLQVLDETAADKLLYFCQENAEVFMNYEQDYPDNYFTKEYQELLLKGYMQQFMEEKALRYFVFLKENPNVIIGCVGLSDIHLLSDKSAKLFYKQDRAYCGNGYMNEAISCLLWHAADELKLHRIEADILPGNERSIAVAKRLGFEFEGVARSSHIVNGVWRDHERYALIL